MNTVSWIASKRRIAIHEVGHVVLEYLLTGRTEGASIYEVDGVWHGVAKARNDKATVLESPQIWQDGAAVFYGGWAAVHVAIEAGSLDAAPLAVEQVAGDHGFAGATPADEACVKLCASYADPADVEGSIRRARDAAIQMIRNNLKPLLELTIILETTQCIRQLEVEDILRRGP